MFKTPNIELEKRIINLISSKFMYEMQIYKELNLENEIKFQGLKVILDRMVERKEVAYLDNNSNNKEVIKLLFGINLLEIIKRVYIGTPSSWQFYNNLINHVENIGKTEKYKEMISNIVDIFRAFEVSAHVQNAFITNDDRIRKDLKESGKVKRITNEIVETRKEQAQIDIQNFFHEEISVRLLIDDIKVKKENEEFLNINGDLIPIDKLVKFMRLMHFSPIMYWFCFGQKANIDNYVFPLVNMMKELFVDIIKDAQIKV